MVEWQIKRRSKLRNIGGSVPLGMNSIVEVASVTQP